MVDDVFVVQSAACACACAAARGNDSRGSSERAQRLIFVSADRVSE